MTRYILTLILAVYLVTPIPVAHGAQAPVQLPDGEGKPHVQGLCATCHELNLIPRSSGYTRAGWRELIGNMINIAGTPAEDAITQYLATNFPPNTKLQPTLVPGPVSISFREWKVPQLGQRARPRAVGRWLDLVLRAVWQCCRPDQSENRRSLGIHAAGQSAAAQHHAGP